MDFKTFYFRGMYYWLLVSAGSFAGLFWPVLALVPMWVASFCWWARPDKNATLVWAPIMLCCAIAILAGGALTLLLLYPGVYGAWVVLHATQPQLQHPDMLRLKGVRP